MLQTNKPLFIVLYKNESQQWPESSLKFQKNAVTYATLAVQETAPVTQTQIYRKECSMMSPLSKLVIIQLKVQILLLWVMMLSFIQKQRLIRFEEYF